ncbi:metalloregulator ArsR/SmtB family transcription factor [Pseudogracilibacillus sp. SE30717A]|uniref:ArsR/SmtB family transcription factor n=1 Tax=Pseudogracilibacillus sp. SE30717A TaxID=3098293 RepID=UPI00300DFC0D
MLQTTIEMDKSAEIFKLLGNETRLTMLKILDDHDCCVCEFVEIFKASQPSISQHIRKLRDIGLVKEERRGQWIFYSINEYSEFYPFIIQLLNLLPQQNEKLKELELKGTRVQCE